MILDFIKGYSAKLLYKRTFSKLVSSVKRMSPSCGTVEHAAKRSIVNFQTCGYFDRTFDMCVVSGIHPQLFQSYISAIYIYIFLFFIFIRINSFSKKLKKKNVRFGFIKIIKRYVTEPRLLRIILIVERSNDYASEFESSRRVGR